MKVDFFLNEWNESITHQISSVDTILLTTLTGSSSAVSVPIITCMIMYDSEGEVRKQIITVIKNVVYLLL